MIVVDLCRPFGRTVVLLTPKYFITQVICPFPTQQLKQLPLSNHAVSSQSESSSPAASPTSTSPIKVIVRALYDFEMKEEEKEDCLKFKKVS